MKKAYLILLLILLGNNLYAIDLQDIYDVLPNPEQCVSGTLKSSEKEYVRKYINYIRSLHGLKPLEYDASGDLKAQSAALMMVANNDIDHQPPAGWQCYSQDGYDGANKSSLFILWGTGQVVDSKQSIINWMLDNNVPQLGHRFAIIHPHLKKFSFGRSEGKPKVSSQYPYTTSITYKYLDNLESQLSQPVEVDFVGYPQGEYPKELVNKNWYLSFTAVADKERWYLSKADYSNVKIELLDSKGNKLPITDTTSRWASSAGVMNIFQWKTPGLQDYEEYTVNIGNVKIGQEAKDYSWKFTLGDYKPSDLAAPLLEMPENNRMNVFTLPLFTWQYVEGTNIFDFQLSEKSDFSTLVVDSAVSYTMYFFGDNDEPLKLNTKYYWRVRARNIENGATGPWSVSWSFTTPIYNPIIKIIEPKNDSAGVGETPVLKWDYVGDYDYFKIMITTTPSYEVSNIDAMEYKLPAGILKENTKYTFFVFAYKSGKQIAYESSEFTTGTFTSVEENTGENIPLVTPNPANNRFTVNFILSEDASIEGALYSAYGAKVLTLDKREMQKGERAIPVDANLAQGSYYLKLKIGEKSYEIPIIIVK